MEITGMEEHEDGSATLNVDMTEEETMLVIQAGLESLIREFVERKEKENGTE